MYHKLVVMQWNACSLSAHSTELKHYLSDCNYTPDVICVGETWLKPGKNCNLDGYDVVRRDRQDETARGGVAIFVKSGWVYREIATPDDVESVGIALTVNGKIINIINIYNPPDKDIVMHDYNQIFGYSNLIVTGDLNAHSSLWSDGTVNQQGDCIEQLLEDFNCCLLNTGQGTYQKHQGGTSVLDLTIASSSLALQCSWSVGEDTLGSDHLPTFTVIDEQVSQSTDTQSRWNLSKADWVKYRFECKLKILPDLISDSIDVSNANVTGAILAAATSSVPKTVIRSNRKYRPLPFWDSKCTDAVKLRNKLRNKMNKTKLPIDCARYRLQKGITQKTLKVSATNSWRAYCSTLDRKTKLGSVWRMSKRMTGCANSCRVSNLKHNNRTFETNQDKADALSNVFAQASADSNYSSKFLDHKINFEANNVIEFSDTSSTQEKNSSLNEPFSVSELKAAIKQSKGNTAPGADTITYEMFKELPRESIPVLLEFYNLIWMNGNVPKEWNHAIILPFQKPDKPAADPSSYRPISLTSCVCKIMEKMVTNRLTWYLESNDLLNNAQTGFRKGRSTLDQIIKLQDSIHKYNKNKGFTFGVFLDFEKAYDMLWRAGLMSKLKALGVNGNMFAFVDSFIRDRTMQVQVGDARSQIQTLQNGTPQGSIISPILFLVMINDMSVQEKSGVELSLFADDSAIYKSGSNLQYIVSQVQASVDKIALFCDRWGLKISLTKSTAVVFTNRRKFQISKPLKINGVDLKVEGQAKFLGLIFDSKLTWSAHVRYVAGRCKARLNLMRSLTGSKWGTGKQTLLTVYRALIRSILDYGAVAFDSASDSVKGVLDSIQYQALKICCGAMRGTPLSVLQVDCGELPLELRRRKQLLQYACKVKAMRNHPAKGVLEDHWTNHYGTYREGDEPVYSKIKDFFDRFDTGDSVSMTESSVDPPWHLEPAEVDISLSEQVRKTEPPQILKALAQELMLRYEGRLAVYTDGSKSETGRVSCAFTIPELGIERSARITDGLSVYTSELTALRLAAECLSETESGRDVVVYSDSLSSLVSLSSCRRGDTLVDEVLKTLNSIKNRRLTLVWIPSHVGLAGNEAADRLAKVGLESANVDVKVKVSAQDKQGKISEYITAMWQDRWSCSVTGQHYRQIMPRVSNDVRYVNTNRSIEVKVGRLRFGKCRLNEYLHRIGCHADGLCTRCSVPETIEHLIMECAMSRSRLAEICRTCKIGIELGQILQSDRALELFCAEITDRSL